MNLLQKLSLQFEALCAELLQSNGYQVQREVAADPVHQKGVRFDIVAKLADVRFFIEVKWTRNNPVTLKQLRDWSANLSGAVHLYSAGLLTDVSDGTDSSEAVGLLVVSGTVDDSHRVWLESEFAIQVWDRLKILDLSKSHRHLHDQFNEAFTELDRIQARLRADRTAEVAPDDAAPMQDSGSTSPRKRGFDLSSRLLALPAGRADSHLYEKLCVEIVDYLFGEHLLDARPQMRVEDGLNVLDLVYRVDPSHLFWETLTRDFRARVIIFECKNYADPIGPQQVYTTERYLSVSALRSICFLLSRKPPHAHAELAAFGAMRESGKLMVFLSDEDLIEMLNVRDAQEGGTDTSLDNDPTIILDQKIYDFIARLPR